MADARKGGAAGLREEDEAGISSVNRQRHLIQHGESHEPLRQDTRSEIGTTQPQR